MLPRALARDVLPIVADLADACGDAMFLLAGPQAVALPHPVCVDVLEALPGLTRDIVGRGLAHIDPIYLAKLHGATVSGDRMVVTSGGIHLVDLWNQAGLHTEAPLLSPTATAVQEVTEPCLLLFHHSSCGDNHSHWLLQALPQLGLCEQAGVRPRFLVVQPSVRPYQRDVLAALGYGAGDVLARDPGTAMRFRTLYVGYVDGGLVPDPWIFDRQIAAFGEPDCGPAKLYVSRQDARSIRRLLNEAELIERLRAEGFEIVVPSLLSAADEVAVFRNARLIVGPLGAGLYNAVFTRPGATVVALSDPNYVMEWLPQVAALRGHRIGWMFRLGFDADDQVYGKTHGNWIVDAEAVVARLGGLRTRFA